jgi:hypothetical protein
MATYIYDSEKATHLTSSTQVTTLDKGAVFTIDKTADVATVEVALDDGETVTHFIPATAVDSIAAKSIQIEAADIAALLYADTATMNLSPKPRLKPLTRKQNLAARKKYQDHLEAMRLAEHLHNKNKEKLATDHMERMLKHMERQRKIKRLLAQEKKRKRLLALAQDKKKSTNK